MLLEQIDRMFYELIRLGAVSAGLLPDVSAYTNVEDYEAAKTVIRNAMGNIVEVFGVGAGSSRDVKDVTKITIDRQDITKGTLGAVGKYWYEKQEDGSYRKYKYPDFSSHIEYHIRWISEMAKFERIVYHMLMKALRQINTVPVVSANFGSNPDIPFWSNDTVLYEWDGVIDVSNDKYLEKILVVRVLDAWLQDEEYVGNVPALTTVDFMLYGVRIEMPYNIDLADFKINSNIQLEE